MNQGLKGYGSKDGTRRKTEGTSRDKFRFFLYNLNFSGFLPGPILPHHQSPDVVAARRRAENLSALLLSWDGEADVSPSVEL